MSHEADSESLVPADKMTTYIVMGFDTCPYFQRAYRAGMDWAARRNDVSVASKVSSRTEFHAQRPDILSQLGMSENEHTTCPLVYTIDSDGKPKEYIGGCDKFLAYIARR